MPVAHAVIDGVTRVYGQDGPKPLLAIGPIDLTLFKGEFFSVVGPSGCGKSTLLEIVAGLQPPTAGTFTFEGKPVDGTVPDGVGVVFQEDASFPWLTVADNIAFGLRRAGVDKAEIARRLEYALVLMGLKDFAGAYPAQLSGGMRQRVCIARTLVLQPRLILLDEPFGALDQQTRLLMGDELLKLWRATGATVLLITHAPRRGRHAFRPRRRHVVAAGPFPSKSSRPAGRATATAAWSRRPKWPTSPPGCGRRCARNP